MSEIFDELRAALWSVWHRRWIAIAVAWGVCLLGWLVVSMIPNSYESKARVYVDVQDVLSKQLGIAGDGKEEIMRVRQTLSSAKNLEKVITSTRLGEGVTDRGALDAMIAVGGLGEFAAGNRAKLIRLNRETGTQVEYRVRLADLIRKGDASANVMLMPGDTIIIPESRF